MKYLKFIYILLLVTLLSGCVFNDPKYINLRTKPNLYYYSNEIYEKIKNNKSYSLKVFDVNFYEYHEVSEEDEDILNDILKETITNEVSRLIEADDSIGVKISDNKGLIIQVVDYGEGMEYLIELNNVIDGTYEPCLDYNVSSEYGDIEGLLDTIEDYLEDNL